MTYASAVWVDYDPHRAWGTNHTSEGSASPFNEDELKIILKILDLPDRSLKNAQVAVISPYKGQNRLLNGKIDRSNYKSLKIEIDTIDSFQGKDADLESEIKSILAGGIKKRDITISSPFKREKSVVSKITKYKIDEVDEETENITYSTIQGFKGLENSVIILADIQTYNKPDLMYVAMSRARSALYIFETEHAEKYRKSKKFS